MNVVSLFANLFFLFLATLDVYCIDIFYQFKLMNIVYFCKNNYIKNYIWVK